MVSQRLNRVVRNGRFLFDEEPVRDGTSTDRSGCSGRICDTDKTLRGGSDLQSIGVAACQTIDVLHDDIAKATVFKKRDKP